MGNDTKVRVERTSTLCGNTFTGPTLLREGSTPPKPIGPMLRASIRSLEVESNKREASITGHFSFGGGGDGIAGTGTAFTTASAPVFFGSTFNTTVGSALIWVAVGATSVAGGTLSFSAFSLSAFSLSAFSFSMAAFSSARNSSERSLPSASTANDSTIGARSIFSTASLMSPMARLRYDTERNKMRFSTRSNRSTR